MEQNQCEECHAPFTNAWERFCIDNHTFCEPCAEQYVLAREEQEQEGGNCLYGN